MDTIKYYIEGQLGDLIHSLCVCKYIHDTRGIKADIYVSDRESGFYYGVETVHKELLPILSNQSWVNSFSIWKGEEMHINLNSFRSSPKLFKTNWLEIHFDLHTPDEEIPKEFSWIEVPKKEYLKNALVINRSLSPSWMSEKTKDKYKSLIEQFEERYFICTDEKQYDAFPLKDICPMLKMDNLYDFFTTIGSSKLYLGNQSAPSAMAVAMNSNRVIELRDNRDSIHYINDVNYYSKYEYFIGDYLPYTIV
jgi:hypothetical protein